MTQSTESQATIVFPAKPDPLSFIRLNRDNTVTVISKHLEMGQGIHTGFATLVADEMDAAIEQIRLEYAPGQLGQNVTYGNVLFGGIQGTGGQTSIHSSYMIMRMAGAAMRAMIVSAAAKRLHVDSSELRVWQGQVLHKPTGRRCSFGELAEETMVLPVPTAVTPKLPDGFTYIGKHFPRVDSADKIHGRTVFTQDIKLPGMLVAVIARPTRPGGSVAKFDARKALQFPGVQNVVQIPQGLAVVADNFWSAYEARERLEIEWDNSKAERFSSADISARFKDLLGKQGAVARRQGDVDGAFAKADSAAAGGVLKRFGAMFANGDKSGSAAGQGAAVRVLADYDVPYTTHATYETMNGVMQVTPDGVEIWGPSQIFAIDGNFIAHAAGVPPEKVKLNMLSAGGSFGRRSGPTAAMWMELLAVIKALGTSAPVKLMYSREDDMGSLGTYHRPGFSHRIEAALDGQGGIAAWRHRLVGQSVLTGTAFEAGLVQNGIDHMSVEGAVDMPYAIPNVQLELHSPKLPINVSWMRTTGTFHTCFAIESMMDELARAAGADPLDFRLRILPAGKRERGCLELAAEKANWRQPLRSGPTGTRRGRGLAVVPSHRSYGAAVAEVTVAADNSWTIDRIVLAMDCGLVINPDNVVAQMEGSAGFGLSMARYSAITFKDGEIEQKFYSDHHITRMHTMPPVECHIVQSNEGPSGASETSAAPIAAALANALADATGVRLRQLPLRLPGEPAEEHWDVPAKLNTFSGAPASNNR